MDSEADVDDTQQIAAWLNEVANDPLAFVEGAFPWGEAELEKATGPEPWQRWLLEQIRDGLLKPGEAVKLALASGHGIGKSAACSWIVLWAISTFPGTRGIVTASSEAMLRVRLRLRYGKRSKRSAPTPMHRLSGFAAGILCTQPEDFVIASNASHAVG